MAGLNKGLEFIYYNIVSNNGIRDWATSDWRYASKYIKKEEHLEEIKKILKAIKIRKIHYGK